MSTIHVWPEEPSQQESLLSAGFTLERANGERLSLWYRLPIDLHASLTRGCEPFLLASLFTAMHSKTDLFIHGEISPALLANLEEFQTAWSLWYPKLYTPIEIWAEKEREQPKVDTPVAISCFSGGVDSCYTVWRHTHRKTGRNNQDISAGLFIHGMDIPLGRKATFDRAACKAEILLDSVGLRMIPMTVNLRKLGDNIAHSQGAFLASCLMLLQGGYSIGVIPGTHSYIDLSFPWASNPITDPLLSSENFPIIYDSADVPRSQKILEISTWPEIHQNLRVCLGEDRDARDKNCCQCEKCIRTILNFRALGLGLPACFEHDVSVGKIIKLGFGNIRFPGYYSRIIEDARASHLSGAWIHAVKWIILSHGIYRTLAASSLMKRTHQALTRNRKDHHIRS